MYCSPACKQRAHRARKGGNGNAPAPKATRRKGTAGQGAASGGHCAEAVALLAALDAELSANARQLGHQLEWSAAEAAVRDLIADTIDRRVDLQQLYRDSADDPKLRLKVSGELRLIESALARLLSKITTELPAAPTRTSQKAAQAAHTRWEGQRAKDR